MERFVLREVDRRALDAAFHDAVVTIHAVAPWAEVLEVGSTSVPGMIGKGDLDVLVRCDEARFDDLLGALDRCYPRNPDQFSSPIYQGYTVPHGLDVALQVTVAGGPHDVFEAWLQVLTTQPDVRAAYEALKRRFDGGSMDAYRQAKAAFIGAHMPPKPDDRTVRPAYDV